MSCILLSSCGVGSKYFGKNLDKLGVPKQPTSQNETVTTKKSISLTNVPTNANLIITEKKDDVLKSGNKKIPNWFYLIPITLLVLISLLTYRLKKIKH